ncbi:MAG: toll/interleukin-1 receptor domain-containing protein, partial [Chloroflexi bacterium]|nr:toll/interleukin-1 receptor domain-containing protein [Chloroflexota bacterium]
MSTPQHVFISYARKDGTAYAARLDATLPQQGFNTWRDQRGIDPTQDFTAEIERAIENASYVVTCITPDVRRDDSFVRREIQFAQILKKPIIVARFRDVAPPISVINHTSIDFFRESWTTAFERLCGHLRQPPGEYQPLPPSKPPDIFEPYLSSLYQQIVRYLDKTVFSSLPHQSGTPLITLRSESRPEAVQGSLEIQAQKLTMAFFAMAGVSDSGITLPFEDIQQAYQHYQGRLLILGNPGAGKTTTLMAFARDCVAKRLDDVS